MYYIIDTVELVDDIVKEVLYTFTTTDVAEYNRYMCLLTESLRNFNGIARGLGRLQGDFGIRVFKYDSISGKEMGSYIVKVGARHE